MAKTSQHKTVTELTDGEVHLWYTDPAVMVDAVLLDRYESLLSNEELASYHELQMPSHRREYLISQAFLRDVLSHYFDC